MIRKLSKYAVWFALLALSTVFSIFARGFLSFDNLMNVVRQMSVIGICAVSMTFVILMGAFDLSIGAVVGLSAVVSALLMRAGTPPVLAVLVSLCAGVCVGLFISLIVNTIGIPPIIVSLGVMTMLRGVCSILTGGMPVYGIPKSYLVLGQGYLGGVPNPVIIMVLTFVLGYIILEKTSIGRMIYGTGGNEEASLVSGVPVKRVKTFVFAFEGLLGALGGIVLLSRVNSGQPGAGTGYEMDIITACVLGGISVTGGEGKITSVIVGVLTIGILSNGMVLMGVNEFWQNVVKGAVLLLAVSIDKLSKTRKTA